MAECNNCKHKMCWEYAEPCSSCTKMTGEPTNWEPQTNADRIRTMTDEELADFLCHWDVCGETESLGYNTLRVGNSYICAAPGGGNIGGECQVCAMAWLKSPVEG